MYDQAVSKPKYASIAAFRATMSFHQSTGGYSEASSHSANVFK